jgi:hypothetical protein
VLQHESMPAFAKFAPLFSSSLLLAELWLL